MRDILFKAKRIDNGEWVEGYYVRHGNCDWIYTGRVKLNEEFYNQYGTKIYPATKYLVDSQTICQLTELVDNNRKKIYENDIIKTPYRKFIVTYVDGVWGERDGISMRESIFGEGGVIVGNVFDNPSLLEGETV